MSDTPTSTTATTSETPSVVVDHVDVTYRVYADTEPKLRKLFVGEGRREHRKVHAVRDVSFLAYPGEAIGVVGHNGSGKSSLLRAIAGLLPVASGRVFARSLPVLLGVGAALEPDLSGRRNIYLGGTALGIPRSELDRRFDDIVAFSGLEEFIDLPMRAYSSGMKARLQFSVATSVVPDILMVDEALAVGDGEFRERSNRRIREMMGQAGTVFLVSHSLDSITEVCERALWVDRGQLVMDGSAEEVVASYRRAPSGRFPRGSGDAA